MVLMKALDGPRQENFSTPLQANFNHNRVTSPPPQLTGYPCCLYRNLAKPHTFVDRFHRPLTAFEDMCSLSQIPRYTLSLIYKEILFHTHNVVPNFMQKSSQDLGIEISPGQWHTSFTLTHKSSIFGFTQEKNYKLLSRWYRDPVTVHRMFPNTTDICWRCHRERYLPPCVVGMWSSSPFF